MIFRSKEYETHRQSPVSLTVIEAVLPRQGIQNNSMQR